MPESVSMGLHVTSSQQNKALAVELTIKIKAHEVMWDWTLLADLFLGPITLTETLGNRWRHARHELGFHNFSDTTLVSDESKQRTGCAERSICILNIEDPAACSSSRGLLESQL
ncbi:hypothetical protein C7212DRAFT_345878 [Tuber magnatum]|uniref:Uncharacterized protein n=1 Tax=Tuber magnatum TaxID=42249 RepID=A0A317SJ86_9PEZI|nr:hypothetical protein C7212DRAFT_345878 [Tuber magnatum]